jgi:hypothetical protein
MRDEFFKQHMSKVMFTIVGVLGASILYLIYYVSNTSLEQGERTLDHRSVQDAAGLLR